MQSLIKYFNRFQTLSAEEVEQITHICHSIQLKKHEILQNIGFTCKTIYFVESGIARIFYYKNGTDITECFAFENKIIARVESLFTGNPSKKGIEILEDASIIAINAVELFKLYDKYPSIERLFRLIFEAGYVETVNRIESLQFHSAEERYIHLMNETEIIKKIPLKYIASYLGITQVSLSRIRANIRKHPSSF